MNKEGIFQTIAIGTVILFFLVVIKAFDIAFPIQVNTINRATELAVVGEGKVDVVPDSANVQVGITVTNARTVDEAQAQITKVNNDIVVAMQKLGVDKRDIKTANYSVYPNYDYEGNRTITGYSADVQVTITTKKTDLVAQIVSAATAAGANTISGTSFTVSDPAKYREEARNKAIQNAREQAQKMANNLGITLGKVTNIVEAGSSTPVYPIMSEKMYGGAGGAAQSAVPSFQEGSQTISSVVTLYFEKK